MKVIAKIETAFPTKFGVPRQSGIAMSLISRIVFEKEYQNIDCVKGLEDFSHIWLIWGFSKTPKTDFCPTVRPPRLGGNKHIGVFATRSPFRPNNIGLSSVKLERIEVENGFGPVLYVSGADLVSGTPIYDIKPYLKYTDSHEDAVGGFADEVLKYKLDVEIDSKFVNIVSKDELNGLVSILEQDPRPSYQNDENRTYGFLFSHYEVKFSVKGKNLTVLSIEKV